MTTYLLEQEWAESTDPRRLLELLKDVCHRQNNEHFRATGETLPRCPDHQQRKLRLLAVACVRRHWALLQYGRGRRAVEAGERFADGLANSTELRRAETAARMDASTWRREWGTLDTTTKQVMWAASATAETNFAGCWFPAEHALSQTLKYLRDAFASTIDLELGSQCDLLRDIFGNPFQPVIVDHNHLTSTVLALAQAIYDERGFDRLPILADALEEAGCTQSDLLQHFRNGGEHVRGCWALDLVLAKR